MNSDIHMHVMTMQDKSTPDYPSDKAIYNYYMACGLMDRGGSGIKPTLRKTGSYSHESGLHIAGDSATCKKCLRIGYLKGTAYWDKKLGIPLPESEKKQAAKLTYEDKVLKALNRIAKALENKKYATKGDTV